MAPQRSIEWDDHKALAVSRRSFAILFEESEHWAQTGCTGLHVPLGACFSPTEVKVSQSTLFALLKDTVLGVTSLPLVFPIAMKGQRNFTYNGRS